MSDPAPIEFRTDCTVSLIEAPGEADLDICRNAWVSTKGARAEDEADPNRIYGLVNMLVRDRHGSPFERPDFVWLVEAPIFVFREHMRHRIASYNEESSRYKQLAPVFYIPPEERPLIQEGKPGAYVFRQGSAAQYVRTTVSMMNAYTDAYQRYELMLEDGVAREVARNVLPLAIFSSAYVKMNLRALTNFLSLRTASDAHPEASHRSFPLREINDVADRYEQDFSFYAPVTYEAWVRHGREAL